MNKKILLLKNLNAQEPVMFAVFFILYCSDFRYESNGVFVLGIFHL